jgi:hypothetical protein
MSLTHHLLCVLSPAPLGSLTSANFDCVSHTTCAAAAYCTVTPRKMQMASRQRQGCVQTFLDGGECCILSGGTIQGGQSQSTFPQSFFCARPGRPFPLKVSSDLCSTPFPPSRAKAQRHWAQ